MRLALIAAMGENRAIGRRGALPWSIPDEYAHFRRSVAGRPVLFGRTSHAIFGGDLPDSRLLVVSRSVGRLPGAEVFPSVESALDAVRDEDGTVFSAGGASIYRATLPLADEIHLSVVRESPADADAFFPEIDDAAWAVVERLDHGRWEFRRYERRRPPA